MTSASAASPGQTIRIEQGPKAGHSGTVESVRTAIQLGTNFDIAIIDFTDGSRSVRPAAEIVTVI